MHERRVCAGDLELFIEEIYSESIISIVHDPLGILIRSVLPFSFRSKVNTSVQKRILIFLKYSNNMDLLFCAYMDTIWSNQLVQLACVVYFLFMLAIFILTPSIRMLKICQNLDVSKHDLVCKYI
jgi:hypothetical protein